MFKDHFSDRPADYGLYRPRYPADLFDWLARIAPGRRVAWDCATGSGQAAVGLARQFRRVLATDASAAQIGAAITADNVEYRVAPAEESGLESHCADLLTVAQAAHWLDQERFYGEAARVLRSGGVVALWCYNLLRLDPAVDTLLDHFYGEIVGDYWPAERRVLEGGYRDLPFPFRERQAPCFAMTADWDLEHLLGYLGTWSAVKRYREDRQTDPREWLAPRIAPLWGDPAQPRRVRWPLALRVGCTSLRP